jgi:hypothetical protein
MKLYEYEELTNLTVMTSPGRANRGGCLIHSPNSVPHLGESNSTGGTRLISFSLERSIGNGPGSTATF